MAELRAFIKIDRLQPKTAEYLSKISQGDPVPANSCVALLDIASAPDAEKALDILLTGANISVNVCMFDGRGGWIGVHSDMSDEVQIAIENVMSELGLDLATIKQGKLPSHQMISKVSDGQAALISKRCRGHKVEGGSSLFVADIIPAVHTLLAVNEAEKSADIEIVDYKITGSSGRMYISGTDTDTRCAMEAVIDLYGKI